MKRLTTFLLALMLTWIGANAQIANGSYMVVNTETGQFLYGSYNWGCRASLGSKPVFFTVTSTGENTYTLSSQQWTATRYLYLSGSDFYCDTSTSTNITVTETETGSGIYTISYSGSYMYAADGKNAGTTTTTDVNSASHWQFVSLDDVIASMEDASSANPVDVTALINDANFKPGGNNLTATNNWTNSNVTIGSYANNATAACCAEAYHQSTFSISQSITLPKAGYYNLSAQGFYRDDSSTGTVEIAAQMFAGEQAVNLNARQTEASSMAAAWAAFLEGSEPVPSITIYAENDEEEVSIGFSSADGSSESWVIFGELQLEYLGETLEYAIGEPECTTAYVQPGGELTITFPNCVTPNTNEEPVLDTNKSITVNGDNVTDAVLTSTGLTSTVTFTVPTTLTQGAEVTVIVPAGLVTWSGTEVSSPAQDVTFTLHTPAIADQMGVYLMNCNTEEYLSRGYNWGTRADVDYYGIPVDIVADEDGLYTIQYVDNSGYLGDTGWAYGDCGTDRWVHYTIESYNADGVTGYRFKCEEASTDGTDRYLYLNENNTENEDVNEPLVANNGLLGDNYEVESQAVWQIHDEAAHTAQKAAFVASQKAAIAALVGEEDLDTYIASQTATDVTVFVEDPSFDSAEISGTSGWIGSYTHTENANNGSFSSGGTTSGFESWNGCIQLQQTITDLPSGVYKIDLKGFFRQATNIICYTYKDYDMSTAFIDANGYEINLAPWASEATLNDGASGSAATDYSPNSKADSYTACATGYANELYTYVGEDGTLVITIDNQGYAFDEWMYLREMSLTYYGDIEDDCDYADGEEVTIDGTTYTVVGENMFVNGGFNYGVEGWTAGNTYTDALSADNVTLTRTGGYNGNTYLTLKSSAGAAAETTPTQAIAVEAGKTYLFVGYTSGTTPTSDNLRYSALFEMDYNEDGKLAEKDHTEGSTSYSNTIIQLEWGAEAGQTSNTWTQTIGVFTVPTDGDESTYGTYSYVGMRMNWSTGSYDGFQLYEVEAVEETIEWEMTEAGWGTLILPFAADVPDGLTLYAGDALTLDEDGTTLTVGEAADAIEANTPYLVSGSANTYEFTGVATNTADSYQVGMLVGTLVDLSQEDGTLSTDGTQYVLQNHTANDEGYQEGDELGLAFYPITTASTGVTLDAYHCYLTGVTTTALHLPGMSTGIVAVESETLANDAIYDLSGRRVSKAVKGVYIQNGKKVLVK